MTLSPRLAAYPDHVLPLTNQQVNARDRVKLKLLDGTYSTETAACFCGEEGGVVIAERDRYGLPVTTVLCPWCGLMRTSPRMTAATTAKFYEEDYRDLYSIASRKEDTFKEQITRGGQLRDTLAPLLKDVQNVYEIGCGAGGILVPFAEAGMRVAGCDLGDEYLELGRAHGLDLIQGDVSDLLCSRGELADLVILSHVAEHFLDLREELKKVVEAVVPGGLLLVVVPGIWSIRTAYRGDILLYLQNAHTFHFSGKTLAFVLQSIGLDVLFVDEQAVAIAGRPTNPQNNGSFVPMPKGEPTRVLRFLADTEKSWLEQFAQ
ncbi:MAG: class I SAM-dependent methyltransferase [Pseudomonadota bacterium]